MSVSRLVYHVDPSGDNPLNSLVVHQEGRKTLFDIFQYNNTINNEKNLFI